MEEEKNVLLIAPVLGFGKLYNGQRCELKVCFENQRVIRVGTDSLYKTNKEALSVLAVLL